MTQSPITNTGWVKCPSCRGKGHVFDADFLLIPFTGWALAWGEKNDAQGLSRCRCGQCEGKGFLKL